ncbi:ABC transporter permease [Novilysobacter antarcticus]|uniref:ABC transporter permease n=1 Tax=Novilysobacter antarcticus TaxID=2862543 RepID=UPI001C99F62F|nr:ABC transporter permease [Lysobacter antarcticus]
MGNRFLSAASALGAVTRHGSLTWEMTKREVLGRYRGASLGLIWTLLGPLMMVIVYSVAFGEILRAKWPVMGGGTSNFALILFAGLIVHGFFAECLMRSPMLVVSNPNYVKRIIFPLEILPWPMLLSALFHFTMNLVVFTLVHLVLEGPLPSTIVLVPLVILPMLVLLSGLAWFLAALGVYFRDINQITGPIATAMLFLSSAIIPVSALPDTYQKIFHLNPLTFIIDEMRNVALWGILPNWSGLAWYLFFSLVFAYLGSLWFQSTRRGFADVL